MLDKKKLEQELYRTLMRKLRSEMISDIWGKNCNFTWIPFLVGALSQVQNHFQKHFFF